MTEVMSAGAALVVPGEAVARQLEPADSYAAQPLPRAFTNLELAAPLLQSSTETTFDVTAFYSRRRPDLDAAAIEALAAFDRRAVAAAQRIGGLLLYYQGEDVAQSRANPALGFDFTPTCLSFCIWESRQQARRGADVPGHRIAAAQAATWYESFAIKKYDLRLEATTPRLLFTEIER